MAIGHIEIVSYLLTSTKVDVKAYHDYTVNVAAGNGYLDLLKLLISHGAEPTKTALQQATKNNFPKVVEFLHTQNLKEDEDFWL